MELAEFLPESALTASFSCSCQRPKTNDQRPASATVLTRMNSGLGSRSGLAGSRYPHDKGLGGHSDGDVLLHAITDALLGAIAAPDIGALFPPSDAKWKGADSVIFLHEALKRVRDAGYRVGNIDASLILAAPKIGPHSAAIRTRVSGVAGPALRLCGSEGKNTRGIESGECGDRTCGGAAGKSCAPKRKRRRRRGGVRFECPTRSLGCYTFSNFPARAARCVARRPRRRRGKWRGKGASCSTERSGMPLHRWR